MPGRPWYTISSAARTDAAPDYQTQASLDGTTDTGANTSSAQPRARAPPLLHSYNSARQSRVNAVPFQPPRNERRLAPSSDMGDTRTPATRTEHWDRDEVVDVYSEDEDYDPETDEVESFDDHVDDLFAAQEAEHQGNANSRKDIDFWEVDVIENSMTQQKEIAELGAQLAELKAEVAEMKAERQIMESLLTEMKAKRQIMERLLRYLIQQQGDNLPPDVVADLDSLGSG
ncbi:uncharacterized protein [Arachis hypogaea]|uniref:uncharacterized protein n=1 Tax=Arachis hypogaea TaxID=3818 RepID=UPI000DEC204E|nr:uncharacterized protein LOC112702345 [Arachis hypogaea]QHO27252.1 uncharacterized protein DS421_7g206380 [Arachis hypogaea]